MKDMPVYEVPTVETYTDAELLEALGPAQASAPYGGGGGGNEEPIE